MTRSEQPRIAFRVRHYPGPQILASLAGCHCPERSAKLYLQNYGEIVTGSVLSAGTEYGDWWTYLCWLVSSHCECVSSGLRASSLELLV